MTARSGSSRPRPSALEWVALVAGLFLVNRYAWLLDDAFIYFRYVDNAVFLGRGLVYNAGEYVEGYSSPLWTLLLLVLRQTEANWWILVRLLGAFSFVAFWWTLVCVDRELNPLPRIRINVPLLFLSLNYGVASYFTSGLESPLVQVAAGLYALLFLRPGSRAVQILVGLTPLLRHELLLPFAVAWIFLFLRGRRVPWIPTVSVVLSLGGWMIFRILYYADLFPNTFYLKDTVSWTQGLAYLHDTAWPYGLYLTAPLLLFGALRLRRTEDLSRPGARLWMVAAALPIVAYVVKIGGDPRHYRYLAFALPLLVCASGGVVEAWLARGGRAPVWTPHLIGGLVLASGLVLTPRQVEGWPWRGEPGHRIVDRISDATLHRHHPTLAQDPWGRGRAIEQKDRYAAFLRQHPGGAHTGLEVGFWCVTLYGKFEARVIHSLGLTDPILARTRMDAERTAHKEGLRPLAVDLARLHARVGERAGPGMYRAAVAAGLAAPWIRDNVDTIEVIARKTYNRHDPVENLRLAFSFPPRIQP